MSAPGTNIVEANPFLPKDLPTLIAGLEEEAATTRETVEALTITTPEEAKAAGELAQKLNRRIKEIETERVGLTKPRKDAAEEIKRLYDGGKAPYIELEQVVRKALEDFRAEERRAAKEAQRKVEEERRRVEAEAAEKRAAAEQAAREAEEMQAEAEDQGDAEAARELADEALRDAERAGVMEQAIGSLPPQPVAAPTQVAGFSERTKREAFVVDRSKLPDTLPDGTPLLIVDMVALRRWMNEQWSATGEAPELPGAEFKKVPAGSTVRS